MPDEPNPTDEDHSVQQTAKVYLTLVDGAWEVDRTNFSGELDGSDHGAYCSLDEPECPLLADDVPALPTASALVNLILTAEGCMPLLLAALEHAAAHVTPEGSCPACQAALDGALCADHADDRKRADEYTLLRGFFSGQEG